MESVVREPLVRWSLYWFLVPLRIGFLLGSVLFCFLIPGFAADRNSAGSEWSIKTWETEDGLPENSATAMVQTSDGYLWFGTFQGLVRFDGIHFKVFTPETNNGLPHAGIVNLHLDSRERLWVSTYSGVVVREGQQWRTIIGPNEYHYVRSFTERKNGDVLMITFDGVVMEFAGGQLRTLPEPPGEKGAGYLGYVDRSGKWWVVQNKFIGKWDGSKWVATLPASNLPAAQVGCGTARDGQLWLLRGQVLCKYDGNTETKRISLPELSGDVWSVFEDSRSNVWICTSDKGVVQVSERGSIRNWNVTNALSSDVARFAFEDREKNIWIGTSGGGLARFKEKRFRTYGRESGLRELLVQSVSAARSGGAWIATYGRGLFRLGKEGRIVSVSIPGASEGARYVQSVLEDRNGSLWVGTFNAGLYRIQGQDIERFDHKELGGGNIIALFEDSQGRLWIANGNGVAVYDGTEFKIPGKSENCPRGGIRAFREDASGTLWISNGEGVFRLQNGVFEEVKANSKPIAGITCLNASNDGSMWMGSLNHGLRLWRSGELMRLDESVGFPLRTVYAMEQDGQGFFWITSNQGVLRAKETEMRSIAERKTGDLNCQIFDSDDGLATAQCTSGQQPLIDCDSEGRLWMATTRGLSMIKPAEFRVDNVVPNTRIEMVRHSSNLPENDNSSEQVLSIEEAMTNSITFPAGSQRFEFHYTALNFAAPEKIRFQTKLEGRNQKGTWEDAGSQRVALFHELSPGSYTFSVRGENSDGVRDERGATIAFTVLPFIWQTTWFRLSGATMLLLAGWSGARWRFRAAEKVRETTKQMALATEVAHLGVWQWDIASNRVLMTATCSELFGLPPATVIDYPAMLERIHPEDRGRVEGELQTAMGTGAFRISCRLRLPNQRSSWIETSGVVDFDRSRKPVGVTGVCMDVSERRNAEDAARELSGRLIHAQEDERRRLARDLHDDLNQRLALLSVEMELLGNAHVNGVDERGPRLEQVAAQIKELSSEVHKLSYRLHPAKLDQLGLVAAARSFCRELAEQSKIEIVFAHENVPRNLPDETALCLYRVLQESLQNMVRHSHATEALVRLGCANGHLELNITDSGCGFDVEGARRKGGLGLISMEERVRLVQGVFKIKSQPGFGTETRIIVPLASKVGTRR